MNQDTTRVWRPTKGLRHMRGLERPEDLASALAGWRPANVTDEGGPRYRVAGVLGRGSQGIVFEVEDRDCRRRIALKSLHSTVRNEDDVSRFIHEAQITAQLEHPGIVPVHDLETLPDGTVFYTMKRIEGRSLAEILEARTAKAEGVPSDNELYQIFLRICDTIAFAHDRGVVHRDLKPRNLMLGAYGEVLVLDWGLAKILGAGPDGHERAMVESVRSTSDSDFDIHQTLTGCAVGTPAFMSPEQARGEPADERSDIYALGVILYHLLAGCSPYEKGAVRATLRQAAEGRWTPLEGQPAAQGLPRRLLAIVHKAMSLQPDTRYQHVSALAADLRRYLANDAVVAYRERSTERLLRWATRHRRILITTAGAVGLGLVAGAAVLGMHHLNQLRQAGQLRALAAEREVAGLWAEAMALHERILQILPADRAAREGSRRAAVRNEQADAERAARNRAIEASTWKARAAAAVSSGAEADLELGAGFYLRALGLAPDDPDATEGYRDATARFAALVEARRLAEVARQAAGEREATAAALLGRATTAEQAGSLAAAVGFVESALTIQPSPAATKRLGELIALRQSAETQRQSAARRAEADSALRALAAALAAGDPPTAAAELERARGFDPAHPGLPAAAERVAAGQRAALASAAETALASAAVATAQAASLEQRLANIAARVEDQRAELAEQGGADIRLRLHASESELATCAREHSTALAAAIANLDHAAATAPWHPPVRAALADWWMARLVAAEAAGDEAQAAAAEAQAKTWDDGSRAAFLAGEALLTVPAGAQPITLRRLATTTERTLAPDGPALAALPGVTLTVPRGRWLAESAGAALAVRLDRGTTTTLHLPPAPPLEPGLAWIPGGTTKSGDTVAPFALMRREVSCQEWLAFLNDPEIVRRYNSAREDGRLIFAPRATTTADEPSWRRRRNEFLAERVSGEALLANAPVTGISYDDACAFAAWRARREGHPWRLPTAGEWRFAVQGGDGRAFPWGDLADPSHCASYRTCPADLAQGVPSASFAIDCSVQGVFDLAGSVSEFVASDVTTLRLVLGGNRMDRDGERFAWTAKREFDPRAVHAVVGLRLAYTP